MVEVDLSSPVESWSKQFQPRPPQVRSVRNFIFLSSSIWESNFQGVVPVLEGAISNSLRRFCVVESDSRGWRRGCWSCGRGISREKSHFRGSTVSFPIFALAGIGLSGPKLFRLRSEKAYISDISTSTSNLEATCEIRFVRLDFKGCRVGLQIS